MDLANRSSRLDRVRAAATRGIRGATARPAGAGRPMVVLPLLIGLPTSPDEAQGAAGHALSDCCKLATSAFAGSGYAPLQALGGNVLPSADIRTGGSAGPRGNAAVCGSFRCETNKIDRWIDQPCVGTYTEPSPATILDADA